MLGKFGRNHFDHRLPEGNVEPDVRIVGIFVLLGGEKPVFGNVFRHRYCWFHAGQPLENVGHPAFQFQSVEEDDVGPIQTIHIAGSWPVEVGINAWPHQAGYIDMFAADIAHSIGNHASGGYDIDFSVIFAAVVIVSTSGK